MVPLSFLRGRASFLVGRDNGGLDGPAEAGPADAETSAVDGDAAIGDAAVAFAAPPEPAASFCCFDILVNLSAPASLLFVGKVL